MRRTHGICNTKPWLCRLSTRTVTRIHDIESLPRFRVFAPRNVLPFTFTYAYDMQWAHRPNLFEKISGGISGAALTGTKDTHFACNSQPTVEKRITNVIKFDGRRLRNDAIHDGFGYDILLRFQVKINMPRYRRDILKRDSRWVAVLSSLISLSTRKLYKSQVVIKLLHALSKFFGTKFHSKCRVATESLECK